ncbi:MAG: dienelactone hydrolase [Clostridia bacterium]|nr:dienelactone hydrolase [Clostridia bacterium]
MNEEQKLHPMGTVLGDPLPGAPVLAARGNTVTGVRTITLIQPGQADVLAGKKDGLYPRYDRPLTVEVWYPALPGTEAERAVYTDHMGRADQNNLTPYSIDGRAYRNAAPDPSAGPCPVIVISHGYPGSRILLVNLAENLSSKGYVVLSIGHTDNTYEDFAAEGSIESAVIHRSLDQRFVISHLKTLNEEGFLRGLLLPDTVGLIGFSMGGYGALRTVGARISQKVLADIFAPVAEEVKEEANWHGDKTVKAAVLFAPAAFWFDPAQSGDIDIPTLWFCGTADKTVGYDAVRQCCEGATNSDRIFITYERCGHNVANNPAPLEAKSASWEIYKRWADPVWDTWKINNLNCHFVTAFMDGILKGDAEKAAYLNVPTPCGKDADSGKGTGWPGFPEASPAGVILEHLPPRA